MSERFATWISIGGQLRRARVEPLLQAVREASVRTDWGEKYFEPQTADGLLAACRDGRLRLCDEEARWGELPELEAACRRLKLAYRRHCEGWCGYDAILVDWRPGLKEPAVHKSSNEHTDEIVVLGSEVRKVITLLEAGQIQKGLAWLKKLCPDLPELPPFEIV